MNVGNARKEPMVLKIYSCRRWHAWFAKLPLLLFFFAVCFSLSPFVFAQGKIEVIADERLQQLLEKHIQFNEQSRTVLGYRIRVAAFSGEEAKTKAFQLKEDLLSKDSRLSAYIIYDDPNFVVKWGDFISRLDAYAAFQAIKTQYPSANIVRDDINLPKLTDQDLINPEYLRIDP